MCLFWIDRKHKSCFHMKYANKKGMRAENKVIFLGSKLDNILATNYIT